MEEELCAVLSSYQGSGRPDSMQFEGSREECENYIEQNSSEHNTLGLTCGTKFETPFGDFITEDSDGFLQWK